MAIWRPNRDRRVLRQAAPGRLLPRGRTRTGLEVETQPGPRGRWSPMAHARIRAHPTTDLPRNDRGAGAVTIEQANAPVAGGTAGRGVRASDLNGPGVLPAGAVRQARNSKSAWRPAAVTAAHRPCQVLHRPGVQTGAKRPPPFDPLTPSVATRQARPPGRPSLQVTRAAASNLERAAPAGGAIREPPALVDRVPDGAFAQRSPLPRIGPRRTPGEALLGLQQPTHHQQPAHQVVQGLAGGSPRSRSLSALVDTTRACALLTG
jgi:hypothetical protein